MSDRQKRPPPLALLVALRPKQWAKNLWVLAAVVLTGDLFEPEKAGAAGLAFLLFCAASSAVYLLNDFKDIEADRAHPSKRNRPLAAGELSPAVALTAAAILAAGSVSLAFLRFDPDVSGLSVGMVLSAYLILQFAYTHWLKHMIIVDAMTIAGGFVLRVVAGGVAIGAAISPYLYLSTVFLALLQGFAKRRSELEEMAEHAASHRQSLDEYSIGLLDQFMGIAAASTIVTYALYVIDSPFRPETISVNLLLLTVPFVVYAVLRYVYLVQERGLGGAPEEILFKDRLFLLDVLAWAVVVLVILYLSA